MKLLSDVSCLLYPGSLGCPCPEDSGACADASFICGEAGICVSPAEVCVAGDLFCQCKEGLCVEGSRCLVHETRDICVPLTDDDPVKVSIASVHHISFPLFIALLFFNNY